MNKPTVPPFSPGEAFDRLRERAGLSVRALAKACGFTAPNSIQNYTKTQKYDAEWLPLSLLRKAESVMVGKGDPPITRDELYALAGPLETSSLNRDLLLLAVELIDEQLERERSFVTTPKAYADILVRMYDRLSRMSAAEREAGGAAVAATIVEFARERQPNSQ